MTPTRTTLWLWAAVLLPVVGMSAIVARSEVAVRTGQTFRIPIRGFDPRDLMHGHYLQYQYDFNWQGDDSCTVESTLPSEPRRLGRNARTGRLSEECCLCLSDTQNKERGPAVRQVHCNYPSLDGCAVWLQARDVMPPQRYFVPEEHANALEEALRTQPASIELAIVRDRPPAIRELYLRDRPWRESLGGAK